MPKTVDKTSFVRVYNIHISYEPDMGEYKVHEYTTIVGTLCKCLQSNCELPVAKFQFLAVPYTRTLGGGFNLTIW